MTRRQRLSTAGAAVLVMVALVTGISTLTHGFDGPVDVPFVLVTLTIGAALGAVGALLVAERESNPLGPLLVVSGAALVLQMGLRELAYDALAAGATDTGWAAVAAWSTTWLDVLGLPLPLVPLLLLFPDGRLPSRWWLPVLIGAAVVAVVQLARYLLGPGPVVIESHDLVVPWDGVLPLSTSAVSVVDDAAGQATILLLLVAAASLVARAVRGTPDTRRRLASLGLAIGIMVAGAALQAVPALRAAGVVVFVVGGLLVPVALVVGALLYRVWDLDPLLVRALVYAGLAVIVTILYVVVVQIVLLLLGRPAEASTTGPNVVATVAVAFAFAPAKGRLEQAARRLVYGERATPYETLTALPQRLTDAPVVDEVLPAIAQSLARGLGAVAAGVHVTADPVTDDAGSEGIIWYPAAPPASSTVERVEVRHLGETVGELVVATDPERPLTRDDRRLLSDLAAQSGAAIRAVRLSAELAARLAQITEQSAELAESRHRIVVAQSQERLRLQRDLHDGVQQRLVATGMHLATIRGLVGKDPSAALAELEKAADSLDHSLDEIREVSRGLHPSMLVARGLVPILRARAQMARQPVALNTDGLDGSRLDPEIEAAAYYACLEALQNAAKHAPHASVRLDLRLTDDRLSWIVHDDGPGFDVHEVRGGSGLTGMRDRLTALGGTLDVTSSGNGTTLRASLPRSLASSG
jgi:signal transduction histidine kinase